MATYKFGINRLLPAINSLKPFLTLATLYMLTDALYDYGLLKVPSHIGDILYFGRYLLVIFWYTIKFLRIRFDQNLLGKEVKK